MARGDDRLPPAKIVQKSGGGGFLENGDERTLHIHFLFIFWEWLTCLYKGRKNYININSHQMLKGATIFRKLNLKSIKIHNIKKIKYCYIVVVIYN